MKKSDLIFGFLKLPIDFGMLVAAGFAAFALRVSPTIASTWPVLFSLPPLYFATLVIALSAFFTVVFALAGLYALERKRGMLKEILSVAVAVSAGFMFVILLMFLRREWFDSRFIMLAAWGFGIVFVSLGRVLLHFARKFVLSKFGIGVERVLLVGAPERNAFIRSAVLKNPYAGLAVVGENISVDVDDCKHAFLKHRPTHLILSDPSFSREAVHKLSDFCEEHHVQFSFVPDTFGALTARMDVDTLNGLPLVEVKRTSLDGWGKIVKRAFDIVGSLTGLVVFSPLLLIVALFVSAESKGPIFVRLTRVHRSKEFTLYKFRSMVPDAAQYKPFLAQWNERGDGPLFKMRNDPRVTRVGKVIRKSRLDELPQLLNVLRGEMSLVGPRPHEPEEVLRYAQHHKKVFAVKSGITGLAQVSGADTLPFEEEVKLDRYYLENWSLRRDIVILVKTLGLFLFSRSGK